MPTDPNSAVHPSPMGSGGTRLTPMGSDATRSTPVGSDAAQSSPVGSDDALPFGSDGRLAASEVTMLLGRPPFANLDRDRFSKNQSLGDVLRDYTTISYVRPGEVLVHRGDYGHCAYFVLSGSATAITPRSGGTPAVVSSRDDRTGRSTGRFAMLRRLLNISGHAEVRSDASAAAAAAGRDTPAAHRFIESDQRPAMIIQDFDAVFENADGVDLNPGELFGEVAAMYRSPHAATVVARTEMAVLKMDWRALRLLRRDPAFAETMDAHFRRHWLIPTLRATPILAHLNDDDMAVVARRTELRSYGRLQWYADFRRARRGAEKANDVRLEIEAEPVVVREGSSPTDVMLVRSGFGRVGVDYGDSVQTTAYLGRGHWFGLEQAVRSISGDDVVAHDATLRAVGLLDLLVIPIEVFATHIHPRVRRSDYPPAVRRWIPTSDRRRSRPASPKSQVGTRQVGTGQVDTGQINQGPIGRLGRRGQDRRRHQSSSDTHSGETFGSTAMLEFVVGNRLANGTAAMVIDLDRCTRCDDCVKACASVHDGNPRFARTGPRHDRLQFASACMHCVDPVCMIGCPTGSIRRDAVAGVVSIDDPTCIGCGTCAAACPYDNISMVEIVDALGHPHTDAKNRPVQKATACDLCTGAGIPPACVDACGQDALERLDLSHANPLDQWLRNR